MGILNEIARLAGWALFVVILGCMVLVIITGIQNLIDEIKWRIRRKSIPGILHKHHLNVVIISKWGEPSFSVEITDEKNVHLYHDDCKWKDRNKVIYRLLKGYLEEAKKND